MRLVSSFLAARVLLISLGWSHLAGSREADGVVARIGEREVTISELALRLDTLPSFQRRSLGATSEKAAKRYLEAVVVPEGLLALHGHKTLAASPRALARERAILRDLLIARLAREVAEREPVGDQEVRAYFEQHPELFTQKERIRLQRLLVGTEKEAMQLIAQAKELPTVDAWRSFVRKHSMDKATSERGGELGFVAADGSTDVAELEVDPALYTAAKDAKDGELLDKPVKEGGRFAVVFRRGSRRETLASFSREAPKIRQYLHELRVERTLAARLEELRKHHVREHHPERLDGRDLSFVFERGLTSAPPGAASSTSAPPASNSTRAQ
jgi:peptidyl-prolyl cis-trans isomerase C